MEYDCPSALPPAAIGGEISAVAGSEEVTGFGGIMLVGPLGIRLRVDKAPLGAPGSKKADFKRSIRRSRAAYLTGSRFGHELTF